MKICTICLSVSSSHSHKTFLFQPQEAFSSNGGLIPGVSITVFFTHPLMDALVDVLFLAVLLSRRLSFKSVSRILGLLIPVQTITLQNNLLLCKCQTPLGEKGPSMLGMFLGHEGDGESLPHTLSGLSIKGGTGGGEKQKLCPRMASHPHPDTNW